MTSLSVRSFRKIRAKLSSCGVMFYTQQEMQSWLFLHMFIYADFCDVQEFQLFVKTSQTLRYDGVMWYNWFEIDHLIILLAFQLQKLKTNPEYVWYGYCLGKQNADKI